MGGGITELEKRSPSKGKILYLILIVLLASVFLYSALQILLYVLEGKDASDVTEEIIHQVVTPATPMLPAVSGTVGEGVIDPEKLVLLYPDISVNVKTLREKYPDAVAWLYLPGTEIHYPVMQTESNSDYLHRLPNGKQNSAGSLFLDAIDPSDFSSFISIIYGHNMNNGSMFGRLMDYRFGNFFEEHPYMFLFTEEETYRIELFAGVHTNVNSYVYYRTSDPTEMERFISESKKRSTFSASVSVTPEDRVLVLSTCSGGVNDPNRFVVMGKLVPLEF